MRGRRLRHGRTGDDNHCTSAEAVNDSRHRQRGSGEPRSEPPAESPAWPPALTDELRHGDDVFGVYLAVEHSETAPGPKAHQAVEDAAAAGYETGVGTDIDCDRGAREQLGLDPTRHYAAVALYFRAQEDAQQLVDLFEPGVVGTAEVAVMCLD